MNSTYPVSSDANAELLKTSLCYRQPVRVDKTYRIIAAISITRQGAILLCQRVYGVPAAEDGVVETGAVIQQVGTRLRKLLLSVITEPVVLRGEPLPLENIRTVCRLRLPERSILVIGRRTTVRQHHTHAAKMVLHIQQNAIARRAANQTTAGKLCRKLQ